MSIEELQKDYKDFLDDTNRKDNKNSKNIFKKDYITWYTEMFGMNDERTKDIINKLEAV